MSLGLKLHRYLENTLLVGSSVLINPLLKKVYHLIFFQAPDGSGFLMGYFENIDTNVKTTLFPFAITDNANRPLSKISSVNFQNSHRRCLCACACFTFGLAYELWAQIEIDEAKQVTPEPKKGITRTPTKPKQEPEPVESIEDKDYGKPIAQPALEAVVQKIMNLSEKYPKKKR